MENNKTYKTRVKEFLGYDVRTVRVDNEHEYIVCKDMFDVLGLVKDNGSWASAKKKMLDFLQGIDEKESVQTLDVLLKQGKSKVVKEVDCLNIEVAPTVLTQFKSTQRRGKEILNTWFEFMKFINMLLKYHDLHKYTVLDMATKKYLK